MSKDEPLHLIHDLLKSIGNISKISMSRETKQMSSGENEPSIRSASGFRVGSTATANAEGRSFAMDESVGFESSI